MVTTSIQNYFENNGEKIVVDHVLFGKKVGLLTKILAAGIQI